MHRTGRPFLVVVQLTSGGSPATGMADGDFTSGVIQLRHCSVAGTSPGAQAMEGGTHFHVEEMFPGTGQYALKFLAAAAPVQEGVYSILVSGGPHGLDPQTGVLQFAHNTQEEYLLWAQGVNTVGVVDTHDEADRPTAARVYGFSSAADAIAYYGSPGSNAHLVRATINETYEYQGDIPKKYLRRVT